MSCEGLQGPGDENEIYELPRDLCEEWFGGARCARVGTIGEGSCFYHSLCFCMDQDGYTKTTTMKDKKNITHSFRKQFEDSFTEDVYNDLTQVCQTDKPYEKILSEIGTPTKWADEMQIRHASNVLNINVMFIDLRKKKAYCGVHSNKVMYSTRFSKAHEVPTIIVAWINNEHFEPIVRLDDIESGKLRTMFRMPEDQQFLESLLETYKTRCNLG